MKWIRVSMRWATFALGAQDGVIAQAPPIARWTVGKTEAEVARYYRRKGAQFEVLNPDGLPIAPVDPGPRSPDE